MVGLRSLFVYSSTGAGRSTLSGNATARKLVQSAFSDRRRLFSEGQQSELEGFCKNSKASPLCCFEVSSLPAPLFS